MKISISDSTRIENVGVQIKELLNEYDVSWYLGENRTDTLLNYIDDLETQTGVLIGILEDIKERGL